MPQVVLRLDKFFFSDDDTLKSIASHLMLEQFGAEYDDAVFLHVRQPPRGLRNLLYRAAA